jgi:predicted Zn-dependent protease
MERQVWRFGAGTSTVLPSNIQALKVILAAGAYKGSPDKNDRFSPFLAVMQTKIPLRYCCLVLFLLFAGGCSRSAKSYLQSAKKYFDAGKYEDAVILYRKAIQKEPKSGEAYYRLALADLKLGKVSEAYQALSAASALSTGNEEIQSVFADFCFEIYLLDPNKPKGMYDKVSKVSNDLLAKNKNSYDGLRLKGYLAMADNKPTEAIDALRHADQLRPLQPQVVFPLSKALILNHQEQAAEKLALASIQKNKTFGPMYDVLFNLYSGSGRQQEAENILKTKVDNNPKQASYVLNLAAYYQFQKRPDDVKKTLQRLIDHPKDYQHAHALVGDFYLARRDVAGALSEYNQGIASDPKDKAVYQKRIVNTLILEGKKDEAKATVAELSKSQPKDEEVQLVQATMWIESGKPADVDAAINLLKPLVEKKPGDANRRYRLGQAYQLKGRSQEAETEWRASAKNDPAFLPSRMALAELGLQTGRNSVALDYCDEILKRDPRHKGARFLRALALINSSRADEARKELTELLKEAPDSVIAKLAMARLELLQNHLPEAEKQFSELYKLGQPDLRPLDGLLTAYVAEKQPAKALALMEKELAGAPDRPELIARRAEVELRAGQYSSARDDYQKLLAKDANSPRLNRRIGEISLAMGDKDGAIHSFQKATELDPKDARGLVDLGSLLLSSGRKQESLVIFRRALALSPDQPAILNNVAYLIADTGGDTKEALELAQKGLQKAQKDPHLTDTIGFIYWKQHLNDSALQTFRTVVLRVPENATYRLHYANALLTQGDKAAARMQLEAALLKNPAKDEESEIRSLLAKIGQ